MLDTITKYISLLPPINLPWLSSWKLSVTIRIKAICKILLESLPQKIALSVLGSV